MRLPVAQKRDAHKNISPGLFSYSVRHFLGHFSTHAPHLTQASDTSQTLSALFTVRASQGHTLAQSPQNTHTSLSHLSPPSAGAAAPAAGAAGFFSCLGTSTTSTVLVVSGVVYGLSISRHFLGHSSTQQPHWIHLILSIVHVPAALSTAIAFAGHLRPHIPHNIQDSFSIVT